MKLLSKRIACLLLAAVMAVGVLPASALRAQEELPATPVGEEITPAAMAEQPAEPLDADEPAQLAADELTIPGYTRVTSMPTDGLLGKYLIVAPYTNNGTQEYYMLYPGATGGANNSVRNSARLELDGNSAATGYKAGAGASYDSVAQTDFSAAENAISRSSGDTYNLTAVHVNGDGTRTTYYLCHSSTQAYSTSSATPTIVASSNSGFFNISQSAGNNYLVFFGTNVNFTRNSGEGDNTNVVHDLMLFRRDPVTIPGYDQVTSVSQIASIEDKSKLLVVAEGEDGLYAMYPHLSNGRGTGDLPTAGMYGLRCAKLEISGDTVAAKAVAGNDSNRDLVNSATLTAVDMANLHLTIADGATGKYTFASTQNGGSVKLNLANNGHFASNAYDMTVEITGGELSIYNSSSSRYLNFAEEGSARYAQPDKGTDFWGSSAKTGAPLYLFCQGEVPIQPGSALASMLSGDQTGDASLTNPNENPTGQNSWVLTGGRAAQGSFTDIAGARTWAGHFEEYVRYTQYRASATDSVNPSFQRHVINTAYEGQTLQNIVDSFDARIGALKPRAVVYLVEENGSSEGSFAANLNTLITNSLALRGGTGMIVIETLTAADKTAVDNVVNALGEELLPRVLPVSLTLTAEQKTTEGFPNAQGHLAMAKQLADAVAGRTVSTADRWPYGVSNGNFDTNWPVRQSVTANHEGYGTPATLSVPQQAIKTKVDASVPMTWLFMGDSITHGSAWTGGYDSLAQLFEKFVKDDLGRKQDIVINTGSSGATTGSTITDLDRRLIKYDPDVVVLMLGTNDNPGNDDADTTYKNNLRTLLNKIKEKGAMPILRTPPTSNQRNMTRVAGLIQEVMEETAYADSVIFVDQYTLWVNSNWQDVYTDNGLHPDEAGHLWFAHQLINEMGLWDADSQICNLEYLAREMTVSADDLTINGYTRVTELPEGGLDAGYYLFVAPYNGSFYMLYPGATGTGENVKNAAKLVLTGTKATGYKLNVPSYDDTAVQTNFSKADNLVVLDGSHTYESAPSYQVTARENGYVLFSGTGVAYSASGDSVTFFVHNSDNTFTLRNNAPNHGALHFFTNNMNFNQSGNTPANSSFLLFKSDTLPPVPLTELNALIATAEGKVQTDYTAASWAALAAPLAAAKTVAGDSTQNTQYKPVADALKALQAAVSGLQEKPRYPEVPSGATVKELDDLKPAAKTGLSQPFPSLDGGIGGEAGNDSYRIPGITTVKGGDHDGRLVAATDIRWRDFRDSSNIDTAVSYSDDGGKTWNTSIVNYFGDTANTATANRSAIFIDPLITADNSGNLFLVTNAFPAGTCTHGSRNQPLAQSTGFADITLHNGTQVGQRMTIYTDYVTSTQTDNNYAYYLGDFDSNGYADILDAYDGSASGYYADRHFYLYYQKGNAKAPATDKIYCKQIDGQEYNQSYDTDIYVQQNLFFQNATLHVRTCQFIYLVKSADGGVTWSDPVILNPQMRTTSESFYGPGPGAGICLADGTLIVPMYDNGGGEHATCMYSTDGGNTWTRGTRLNYGSESCIVPIDATTLRQFYRDNTTTIHYTDRTLQNGDWVPGSEQSASGAPKQGNNQLSALRYSKKVNGKDIILVSTATSPGTADGWKRQGGKIYAFELKSDKTMTLLSTYVVNESTDWYGYSSLTELKDGSIGLLYETSQTDGHDTNSPGYCGMAYRTIPMNDIIESETQTVSLTPSTAALYTNAAGGNTTIQLNATVTPAGPGIVWTSSNENVATVSSTGLVTAQGDGEAIITATSDSDETASATCTVTVATKIESITVKQDGTAIGSGLITVYTNATDEGHSVTLTAETVPAKVTHPALNWTRPDGAKGQLTLSNRGENGSSITITAVPGERNVGEVTVEVASAEHPEVKTTFKVHVIRKLESDVSISIRGVNDPTRAPQVGQTLEADINNLQMTDPGKAALTYQWKRTKDNTTSNIGIGKTYLLTADDVGYTISVDVTAGEDSFYEGTRSATRSQPVEKADGPLTGPQGLTGIAPSGEGLSDGSITGFGADLANYEFRLAVTDGVENDWDDVTSEAISALAAGTYQVRAKETDTHKAGGFSVVTVPPYGVTTHAIALAAMTNGRVSRSASVAEANTPVTLTVLPETGFRLAANGLSVETSGGSAVAVTKVAGRENEYTFHMPGEAVTVKATFEQLIFTITHELTNLQCSRGAADGHQVAYGASTAITLIPDAGYVLPLRKDITITNSRGVTVTGWTINDAGVITITGGVTSDLYIVALGRPDTHTVNYTLTNGLKRVDAPDSVGDLAAYEGVLGAEDGYKLPETIIVTVGGSLIGTENYSYNKDTGEISISEGKITGNVVITAVGVKEDDVHVTGVTMNREQASVTVGGTLSLTATVTPTNATSKDVVWSSSDPAIAAVDEAGKVTGMAEGSVVITAMTVDGRHTATCTVSVTKPGSSSSSGSSSSRPSTTTETREDGTKVTTVTKPDGTVTETVTQPDGTKSETVTTKNGDVTITVTDENGEELVKTELPAAIPAPEARFDDVPAGHWADQAIHNAAALELVEGVGGTGVRLYHMYDPMTRGSLATVLHRLSQGKTDYESTFKDVAQGKYYTEGVAWAAKAKVVTGYTTEIFAPDDIITREQLAVMLARYAKLIGMDTKADSKTLNQFADGENTGDWAVDGVAWCVENGILKGKGQNDLDPTANVTRAEVAVMLDRFIGLIK